MGESLDKYSLRGSNLLCASFWIIKITYRLRCQKYWGCRGVWSTYCTHCTHCKYCTFCTHCK